VWRKYLDSSLIVLIGLVLILRLFIETSLKNFGPLGSHKIGDLSIDIIIFVVAVLYFIKGTFLKEKIIFPRAWIILAMFGGICTISVFYSLDRPTSILSVTDLWGFILLMLVLANLLNSFRRIRVIIYFLLTVAVLASGEAIYEYLFQLPWYLAHANPQMIEGHRDLAQLILTHRTPTLFLWPNTMAGFLIMVFPLTVGLFLNTPRQSYKGLWAVIGCILMYTLYIELSISSWVSLFLAASFSLVFLKKSLKPHVYQWVLSGLLLLALLVSVVIIKKISFSHSNSFFSRQEFLSNAYYLIINHPIIGNGWSSFGTASAPYAKGIYGLTNYVHNTYIQIIAEVGLLGFLAFIIFLIYLGKDTLPLINHNKYHWLLLAVLTGISACMLDNLSSYTMLLPNVALYWWVLVGILLAFQANINPGQGSSIAGVRSKLFLIAASVVLGCMAFRFIGAEYDYFTALPFIHANINQQEAVTLFQKADSLNGWDKKFELGQAVAYYELYNRSADKKYLKLAHETVLKTMGQASLGDERQAILEKIDEALRI